MGILTRCKGFWCTLYRCFLHSISPTSINLFQRTTLRLIDLSALNKFYLREVLLLYLQKRLTFSETRMFFVFVFACSFFKFSFLSVPKETLFIDYTNKWCLNNSFPKINRHLTLTLNSSFSFLSMGCNHERWKDFHKESQSSKKSYSKE